MPDASGELRLAVDNGFTYFPKQWSMDGMNAVLRYGAQLRQSYLITISVTVLGSVTFQML